MPKRTIGTTLTRNATNIGVLTSIGSPEKSADSIDITTLDVADGYKKFMPGMKDGGEVSVKGFFDVADAGQAALDAAFEDGSEDNYVITFPTTIGASLTFSGVITKYTVGEANLEDPLSFELTIKVTGKPVLATTASGGLTGLSLAGTGGTLAPAFANGTYSYAFSGVTAASVTVTATAANHTLKLYVDGVFIQALTSGQASNAITMAIGSKKLTIVANEAGKTAKTYEVVVIKTA